METLKYCKVRNVKSPVRAHSDDAGIDFFIPDDIDVDTFNSKCEVIGCHPLTTLDKNGNIRTITLKSGQSVLIPSGIKVKVPHNMMLQYTNKSGVASKKHLLVGANVVDCGYTGECHINLHNVGTSDQVLSAGDKIVQGILIPVDCRQTEEVMNEDELYGDEKSERSEGGFGSSGTK